MNKIKLIIIILLVGLISYTFLKREVKTKPPKVEFDFSDMNNNDKTQEYLFVNDLENVFTKEEKENLEISLNKIYRNQKIKIQILTIPSKKVLNRKWKISTSFVNDGILLSFSKSLKVIDIGVGKNIDKEIYNREYCNKIINQIILPEFNSNNFNKGINKGIDELVSHIAE